MKTKTKILLGIILGMGMQPGFAQPGMGIRVGEQTVLTPEVDVSFNHNNNVNLRRRAVDDPAGDVLDRRDSDWFLNTHATLSLRHWVARTQIQARSWFGARRYDKNDILDRDTYGASAGLFWTNPAASTNLNLDISYQRAVDRTESVERLVGEAGDADEFENISERVERDEFRALVNLGHQVSHNLRGSLAYQLTDIDYKLDRLNDRTNHVISAELSRQMTDKTSPYVRGGIGLDDDEGFDGYAEKPFILFGVRHRATDKLNLDLAVGYESYTRTPYEFEPDQDGNIANRAPGEELKDSSLKYTASVTYAATAKTRLSLRARNGYGSVATRNNSSREESSVSLALHHQTTPQLSQRLTASWREDDYLNPIMAKGEEVDERKETLWFQYNVNYQTVRPWLSLFGTVSYEDGSSRIPGDSYTETQITLGARARY